MENLKVIQKLNLALEKLNNELINPNPLYEDFPRIYFYKIRTELNKMLISVQQSIYDENLVNSGMGYSVADNFPGTKEDELGLAIIAAQNEYERYSKKYLQSVGRKSE
jgi:hypothetical protein